MTPAQKESCNRFLTEWMGECWHEFGSSVMIGKGWDYNRCSKCGAVFGERKALFPDYFSPAGFFATWNRAIFDKNWNSFVKKFGVLGPGISWSRCVTITVVDPEIFPYEWAKFLGWEP
jgi:hypothetical protein